jgi:hypothetical protein
MANKTPDLTGRVVGRLTVIRKDGHRGKAIAWLCRCSCGIEIRVAASKLAHSQQTSCGCKRAEGNPTYRIRDLTGQRFGSLVVMECAGVRGNAQWLCKCDCGNEAIVNGNRLTGGNTTSCGCYRVNITTKHGMHRSGTYTSWCKMLTRCTNPNDVAYARYGGRGIAVCERWLRFENFLADMGERPPGTTIDRKENDGNYEPSNCRWADRATQNRNRVQYPRRGIPRPRRNRSAA